MRAPRITLLVFRKTFPCFLLSHFYLLRCWLIFSYVFGLPSPSVTFYADISVYSSTSRVLSIHLRLSGVALWWCSCVAVWFIRLEAPDKLLNFPKVNVAPPPGSSLLKVCFHRLDTRREI